MASIQLRAVLSAPSDADQIYTLNIVICTVSILSALGAGWIILSFMLFSTLRTFRHQLVLGLALSDFWMAINFLSSTLRNLSGHNIGDPSEQKFCSFNGFMTQLFVIQTDYWILFIAVSTFLMLASFKRTSQTIEEHRFIFFSLPWILPTIWAGLGLGIAGYGDIGAWCWFTSDSVRLYVNFIPRWLIIIIIVSLYLRLYFIIRQAHKNFSTFDNDDNDDNDETPISARRPISPPPMELLDRATPDRKVVTESQDPPPHHNNERLNESTARLKRISYQMMTYPIVYMLIWIIPTALRIYQAATGVPAPFGIATVDKACIVVQGLADALVYGFQESSRSVWRARFQSRGR